MAAAESQGLAWSDYIANVLAEKHGYPMPYPPQIDSADQLQMTA